MNYDPSSYRTFRDVERELLGLAWPCTPPKEIHISWSRMLDFPRVVLTGEGDRVEEDFGARKHEGEYPPMRRVLLRAVQQWLELHGNPPSVEFMQQVEALAPPVHRGHLSTPEGHEDVRSSYHEELAKLRGFAPEDVTKAREAVARKFPYPPPRREGW